MKQSASNTSVTEANRETEYAQAVFERLRETLDVLLTDSGTLSAADDSIQPNYDILDNGLRLRDRQERMFDWTPVCDLEEGPNSPDPLTTPALPFPFTARQLASFMLGGWGWFLAERFAGEDGEIDAEIVKTLLGGVRDAKPREAITAAFAALSEARKHVGEPDRRLEEAEREAKAAYKQKHDEAERLHNWREAGITEAERGARVQRRNEAVGTEKADLNRAMEANQNAHATWRRAMVQCLLAEACQASGVSAHDQDEHVQDAKEPPMKVGRNTRDSCEAWCAYMAKKMGGITQDALAKKIKEEADRRKYRMQRGGSFSIYMIVSAIPAGTTGTRKDNRVGGKLVSAQT